jgi:aldose sugar dehydrogenase
MSSYFPIFESRGLGAMLLVTGLMSACHGEAPSKTVTDNGASAVLAAPALPGAGTTNVSVAIKTLNSGLKSPWGLSFLADSRMLATEKSGRLLILKADGALDQVVTGVPAVVDAGQGGLLDVLSAQEGSDTWVWLSYAEAGKGAESGLAGTAVGRGKLVGATLTDWQVIFRQQPKVAGTLHFGSRLVMNKDGSLFVALGERGQDSMTNPGKEFSQNIVSTIGKVVRLQRNGLTVSDNPAWPAGAAEHLYSIGHRNPQGAALHPDTSELWLVEHGPQGGDELNRVVPGANYGWPIRSYGCPYGSPVGEACRIGGGTHAPDFIEPVSKWVPTSTAPAGLMFYTGDKFPEWKGQAFMGALAGRSLWRLQLSEGREVARVQMFDTLGERIRDVRQGPEGWIYLLTDSGKLLRLER